MIEAAEPVDVNIYGRSLQQESKSRQRRKGRAFARPFLANVGLD